MSPVPLHATFTEMDVVRANLLSKSRLLNAAQDFCGQYDFVDYYPSYEMVTYSDPKISWKADGVHVKSDVVGQVINKFQELYYTE